jgi:hypothetical protein
VRIKTYKKSRAFWKHGKHASVIGQVRQKERDALSIKHEEPMYGSVTEAFAAEKKRKS